MLVLLCLWLGKGFCQHNKCGFIINQYSDWILLSTATCFGPHGTIIRQYYDRMTKVIWTPKYGSIFSASHPYYKFMPKLECKKYNINLLKILRVYRECVLKILAGNVYQRWMICWRDVLQNKALGIILKVIQLKHKNIKMIRTVLRLWNMLKSLTHCSEIQYCVNKLWEVTLLSVSQGGSYYARGCAVVNILMDIISVVCYSGLIFMQYRSRV
jgi:hypothetical protein